MDAQDIDIKAREQLADELGKADLYTVVVIWTDEKRAYLDGGTGADYLLVAEHFKVAFDGEDKSPVDDALLERYEVLSEQIREQQKEDTTEVTVLSEQAPQGFAGPASWSHGTEGTEMRTWQDVDGWYGCLQGQHDGNWFEGDDQGPFDSREEIEAELKSQYEEDKE